jgi:rhodanese-related sulfurtransferase
MADHSIRAMSVSDFDTLRSGGQPFFAIDIRIPEEYRAGHVPGSISIPAGQFALQHENFMAVRRAIVIVLSDDPIRPIWAAAQCRDLGFVNTFVLEGGIPAWTARAGHALESGNPVVETFGLDAARRQAQFASVEDVRDLPNRDPGAVPLDVRSSGEFGLGHIPGARWLARGELELGIDGIVPDRATPIVTICDNAARSTLAAATLRSLGYTAVRVLADGLQAWKAAGLTLVDTLDGADVSKEEAQNDAGSTQWTGALARSRADMEDYLAAEEALARRWTPAEETEGIPPEGHEMGNTSYRLAHAD